MKKKRVILLEVNEVPYSVWDRFVSDHPQSATATMFARAHQIETVTEDKGFQSASGHGSEHCDDGHLTPWTTWPTVHRGVTNDMHGILDIGQNLSQINKDFPSVWDILSKNGVSTGVFGSLHSYPPPASIESNSFHVPDPFAAGFETLPIKAEPFQAFSVSATRASGRNVGGLDKKRAVDFLLAAPRLGVKPKTVFNLAKQLVNEKLNPSAVTRRRVYQTVIGFDIFEKLLKQNKPQFASFFANHVAAAMHRYWAAAYPEDYTQLNVSNEWTQNYQNEIDFAMGAIDNMLARLVRFVDQNPDYQLVVASSMGQAPTEAKLVKSELALSDQSLFMTAMGVPDHAWKHAVAMFPNFNVLVDSAYQHAFAEAVTTLKINAVPLDYRQADSGFFSLDFGQPNLENIQIEFRGVTVDAAAFGIHNMPIQDNSLKCADHVPQGSMLIYNPSATTLNQARSAVPTTAIVPSILEAIGCPVPTYMDDLRVAEIIG